MTIVTDTEMQQLLEKYPGIKALRKIQENVGYQEFTITRLIETEITTRERASGDNYHLRIVPRANHADSESLVILSIYDDGLLEILYHHEDFSDEELRLVDEVCRYKAETEMLR